MVLFIPSFLARASDMRNRFSALSLTAKAETVVSGFWSVVAGVRGVTRHDLHDLDVSPLSSET